MADLPEERLPSPRARSEWEMMDDFDTPIRPFRTDGAQPFLVLPTDDGSGPTDRDEVADGATGA